MFGFSIKKDLHLKKNETKTILNKLGIIQHNDHSRMYAKVQSSCFFQPKITRKTKEKKKKRKKERKTTTIIRHAFNVQLERCLVDKHKL